MHIQCGQRMHCLTCPENNKKDSAWTHIECANAVSTAKKGKITQCMSDHAFYVSPTTFFTSSGSTADTDEKAKSGVILILNRGIFKYYMPV